MATCKIIPDPAVPSRYRLLGKAKSGGYYDGRQVLQVYDISVTNYRLTVGFIYRKWVKPSNGYYELARKI